VAQPELIGRAARMLVDAERPLIHAGGGCSPLWSMDEVRELAEYLSARSPPAPGGWRHPRRPPLCLIAAGYGALGAQAAADLVLLVGGRMATSISGTASLLGEPDEQKLIQIDIEPENVALNRPVDLALLVTPRLRCGP